DAWANTAERDFRSLGVDSVGALGLRNRVNRLTGLRLPVAVAFDHPTPRALAEEIVRSLFGFGAAPAAEAPAAVPVDPEQPLAIVGMGCRFPGGVTSPDDLWELVRDGRDAVTALPDRGWDLAARYSPDTAEPGTFYQREAGMLDRVDE